MRKKKYNNHIAVKTHHSKESWIIVAANPLRWKLSERLYFYRRVEFSMAKHLVFIGDNQ